MQFNSNFYFHCYTNTFSVEQEQSIRLRLVSVRIVDRLLAVYGLLMQVGLGWGSGRG